MHSDATPPAEPTLIDVELRPAHHRGPAPGETLTGRCSIGVPLVRPTDPAEVDARGSVLAPYLRGVDDRDILSMRIPCGFTATDEPIMRATLAVSLTGDSPAGAPIAFDLQPDRVRHRPTARPVSVSATVGLDPSMTVDVGPPGETTGTEYYLVAAGEGTSEPEWRFRRTSTEEVVGTHWLTMLLLAPRGGPATVRVALSVTIRRRGLKVIPYRAALPDHIREFVLA